MKAILPCVLQLDLVEVKIENALDSVLLIAIHLDPELFVDPVHQFRGLQGFVVSLPAQQALQPIHILQEQEQLELDALRLDLEGPELVGREVIVSEI